MPSARRIKARELGVFGLAVIFFRAYWMGAAPTPALKRSATACRYCASPAVTGKRTMVYMAVSLAFIAGGILLAYLLEDVEPDPGKTLNAVLFER